MIIMITCLIAVIIIIAPLPCWLKVALTYDSSLERCSDPAGAPSQGSRYFPWVVVPLAARLKSTMAPTRKGPQGSSKRAWVGCHKCGGWLHADRLNAKDNCCMVCGEAFRDSDLAWAKERLGASGRPSPWPRMPRSVAVAEANPGKHSTHANREYHGKCARGGVAASEWLGAGAVLGRVVVVLRLPPTSATAAFRKHLPGSSSAGLIFVTSAKERRRF